MEDFGTKKCIIYEYESKTSPGNLMKIYVDKEVGWPLKMTLISKDTASMSFDLKIIESNIPGLKK